MAAVVLVVIGALAWPRVERFLEDALILEPRWSTDEVAMMEVRDRLRQLEVELDAVPTPIGATAGKTEQVGCGTDSGQPFQPRVVRAWPVSRPDADGAAAGVADSLVQRGWSGPTTPDQFGTFVLSLDRGGPPARAAIFPIIEQGKVFVEVTVDRKPCKLRSD